jgi:hypothetical protein
MHDLEQSDAGHLRSLQASDAEEKQNEVRLLRALNQELTTELFQTCCELQRNPSSLNPLELSALVYVLQIISERLRQLKDPNLPPN